MFFASDNGAPVPAAVMAALARANDAAAMPYGNDPLSRTAANMIRDVLQAPEAAVYLVATGTAANALSLALLCPPFGSVLCHEGAHVQHDECGAPEFFTSGAKLITVPGAHGRMTPETLKDALDRQSPGDVHSVQPGALTITNVTEAGTVYDPDQVASLAKLARDRGLGVHLDGARFANAIVAAGCSPAEMTWKAGIDILTLGGTKNGLMGAEAVVIFDPAKAWEFELRRKRAGHLFSKHRFLAAQIEGWLHDGLWLDMARHANAMAARLARGIGALDGGLVVHPTEANVVFARWPRDGHLRAVAAGAKYYPWSEMPHEEPTGARLVCSWATTEADVDGFVAAIRG